MYFRDARSQLVGAGPAFTTIATCDEGDVLLSGGCVLTSNAASARLEGGYPDETFRMWICHTRKSDITTVEVLARAVCLAQN